MYVIRDSSTQEYLQRNFFFSSKVNLWNTFQNIFIVGCDELYPSSYVEFLTKNKNKKKGREFLEEILPFLFLGNTQSYAEAFPGSELRNNS